MTFEKRNFFKYTGITLGLLLPLATILLHSFNGLAISLYLTFFLSAAIFICFYKDFHENDALKSWAVFFISIVYIGLASSHLILLRGLPLGREHVIFLLGVIFAGDVGAYYVGSSMGKKKLCPDVSKGKTVEGSLGGLLANILMAILFWQIFYKNMQPGIIIFTAMVLGVIGQMGDLTESVIKRSCGVKDSGSLLPGHGGMLDRLDAVLMAAPAFYWILIFSESKDLF
jgi:phosphatidate cytidylyltransferase